MSRVAPEKGEKAIANSADNKPMPAGPAVRLGSMAKFQPARASVSDSFDEFVPQTRSMKSRKSVLSSKVLEQMMHEEGDHFMMLHPGSTFAAVWNIFAVMAIAYIVIAVPFFMVFDPTVPAGIVGLDIFIEVFFICDVVVNFRTGFYPVKGRNDVVIMDPKKVAWNYLRSWFLLDFVSSFPLTSLRNLSHLGISKFFGSHVLKLLKLMRFLRFFKTTKAFRMVKTDNALSKVLDDVYVDLLVSRPGVLPVLKLASLIGVVAIVVHYVACGWWASGIVLDTKSWTVSTGARNLPVPEQYLFSVYWVLTTLTTVGYGDVTAKNGLERAFSVFAMVLGGASYGYIIAKITSVVADADAETRADAMRLNEIALYVHTKQFPLTLQRQVLRYYRTFLKKTVGVDEAQILRDLSGGLRSRVMKHIVDTVISKTPMFSEIRGSLVDLVTVMQLQYFDRGQYMTQKGQASKEMIILASGNAVILGKPKADSFQGIKARRNLQTEFVPVFLVSPGASFGEQCAVGLDDIFRVTVRALTNCDVYILSNADLKKVLKRSIFNALRLRFRRSLVFRMQLRLYCTNPFDSDAEKKAITKLLDQLPEDSMFDPTLSVEEDEPLSLLESAKQDRIKPKNSLGQQSLSLPTGNGGQYFKKGTVQLPPLPGDEDLDDSDHRQRCAESGEIRDLTGQVGVLTETVESLREELRVSEARHARDLGVIRTLILEGRAVGRSASDVNPPHQSSSV